MYRNAKIVLFGIRAADNSSIIPWSNDALETAFFKMPNCMGISCYQESLRSVIAHYRQMIKEHPDDVHMQEQQKL